MPPPAEASISLVRNVKAIDDKKASMLDSTGGEEEEEEEEEQQMDVDEELDMPAGSQLTPSQYKDRMEREKTLSAYVAKRNAKAKAAKEAQAKKAAETTTKAKEVKGGKAIKTKKLQSTNAQETESAHANVSARPASAPDNAEDEPSSQVGQQPTSTHKSKDKARPRGNSGESSKPAAKKSRTQFGKSSTRTKGGKTVLSEMPKI